MASQVPLYEVTFGMAQSRMSEIFDTDSEFTSKKRVKTPSGDQTVDIRDDIEDGDDLRGLEDRTWMEISAERREELLKEADIYLAELEKRVGEPSPRHIARAKALVNNINGL